jgi:hypothetical protein
MVQQAVAFVAYRLVRHHPSNLESMGGRRLGLQWRTYQSLCQKTMTAKAEATGGVAAPAIDQQPI